MLSDYRGNSNPTPGAQASNKPILLAFDQSSQPVFDTLEVTGDFILSSLTGILIADGVNPVTAEAELSTVRGGLGLDASGFAANTLLLADGAGGFTEVALTSGDNSVTFDYATPGLLNIEAVGGGGGGDVTNPMDANLDVGGFDIFSADPGVTIASITLNPDNAYYNVLDIVTSNEVSLALDLTGGFVDMLTVNGNYQANVRATALDAGTSADIYIEAVDNLNSNSVVTSQSANTTGATKSSAINSAGTGTITDSVTSGLQSATHSIEVVPGATVTENLIIADGTITASRAVQVDVVNGNVSMQENAFAGVNNYQVEYTTDNGSGEAQIAYELDGVSVVVMTGNGMVIQNDNGFRLINQTDRAAAGAGTLGNAPTAGDPAFWLGIVINGVTYASPFWAV